MKITKDKLARLISTLFVPPAFTIVTFTIFALLLETESQKQFMVILVALLFGFIAPIVLFIVFRKSGKLADQDALIKEERTIPFFIATGFYAIGLVLLIIFQINIISIAFWFCYISNTLLTILINRYEKISAHTMGAAGPMAALTFVFGPLSSFLNISGYDCWLGKDKVGMSFFHSGCTWIFLCIYFNLSSNFLNREIIYYVKFYILFVILNFLK